MIVNEIMTTRLITVSPDDTLSHAANLLRQYQFHHLPVVRTVPRPRQPGEYMLAEPLLLFEGMLTAQDIDIVVASAKHSSSGDVLRRPWQERRVAEIMHGAPLRVNPNTGVSAAAQILVERGLNCLPVVEYETVQAQPSAAPQDADKQGRPRLVGLLTRSDLLLALARTLGSNEPGMQIAIELPLGDLTPLARALLLATELNVRVRNISAAASEGGVARSATLRLGTINPAPLLVRLRESGIHYTFVDPLLEGDTHG